MSSESSFTLSAREQAGLAARLGGAEVLRRRLAMQAMLEADPQSDETGRINVQRWVRRMRWLWKALRITGVAEWGRRNMLAVRRAEHVLRLRGLPEPFRGRRLLHLSDLHADMDAGIMPAVLQALAGWDYDAVVLTGDYRAHTRHEWDTALAACGELAGQLRPGAPVFAVLGNHDPLEMVPGLEALGWRVLLNEAVPWRLEGKDLWIAGVDDDHTYQTADVARARAAVPDGACALLLSHTPGTYLRAAEAGFAGELCGHTHGGQICLPGGVPLVNNANTPWRLLSGPWEQAGMAGYTSRGAGACRLPARFFCPPEVTRHTLERG
ncbi:MAG: metallophosphoesterase [Opitutales bacterium]|jgi:predicted MPP superfamily phosphohydrolase